MVEIPSWVLIVLTIALIAFFVFDLYCLYAKSSENRRELASSLIFDGIMVLVIVPFVIYDAVAGARWGDVALNAPLAILVVAVFSRRIQLLRRTYVRPSPLLTTDRSE